MTKTIGLTGGIASGKSTVAAMFRSHGVPVIDADVIAREVVLPGSEGLSEIVARFGSQILHEDGSLNRSKLGEIVFDDEHARLDLNRILHPRIAIRSAKAIQAAGGAEVPYVLYEAALLVENNASDLDGLIVVAITPEGQLDRLLLRSDLPRAQAEARIRSQMPLAEKLRAARWVVWNDGPIEVTAERVASIHRSILLLK
ncbi:MAG: dephospho-CoA kinase [Myxococcota bacterium]